MDGSIAGEGESTSESPPETARFVVIAIKSDGPAEDPKVFTPEEHPKASDSVSVEGGTERIVCVSIQLECNRGDLESEGYKICRICHLSPELAGSAAEGWEQIQIGCGCKGDLGFAHRSCAEAWFGVKRNRICEICGLTAKNITGEEDNSFMKLWIEGTSLEANNNIQNLPVPIIRGSVIHSKSESASPQPTYCSYHHAAANLPTIRLHVFSTGSSSFNPVGIDATAVAS